MTRSIFVATSGCNTVRRSQVWGAILEASVWGTHPTSQIKALWSEEPDRVWVPSPEEQART